MMMLPTSIISICCTMLALILIVDGAMQFTLPKDDVVVCTDAMDNVCTAPTSCNKNGKAVLDSGNSFNVGAATQDNGAWLIQGGYTIDFPSVCNVTCQGNCSCDTCTMIEVDDFVTADDKLSPLTSSSGINRQITTCTTIMMLVTAMIYSYTF